MKKHLPNTITSLNLITGCLGLYFLESLDEFYAIHVVLIAAFFDMLDGLVARALKVSSPIGKQLDSLADLVSFGVFPAFFLLSMMEEKTPYYLLAFLVVVFSALRLAKFNIDDTQVNSFRGLPTPANAIMLTSLALLPFELHGWMLLVITFFSSAMLVAPFRLVALKFSSFRWKENEDRWVLICGVIGLFIVFGWTFVPLLIPFYIVVSLVSKLIR